MGLDSYDRFFPNQDTLPKGGFGSLIALPLQKHAVEQGNSLFLDDKLNPYPDQSAFLSALTKISRGAEHRGRVVGVRFASTEEEDDAPWTAPPSRRRKETPMLGLLP